jgi:hypothetical protein
MIAALAVVDCSEFAHFTNSGRRRKSGKVAGEHLATVPTGGPVSVER